MTIPLLRVFIITCSALIVWLSSGDATTSQDFIDKCMCQHNTYRQNHGVPSLVYNASMSQFSQYWANTLAQNNTFVHSGHPGVGENLYWSGSTCKSFQLCGDAAVTAWYNEITSYNFSREPTMSDIGRCGHFTQVVWRDTQSVGIGYASTYVNGWEKVFVVCNYYPAGNWIGEFMTEVLPPKSSCS